MQRGLSQALSSPKRKSKTSPIIDATGLPVALDLRMKTVGDSGIKDRVVQKLDDLLLRVTECDKRTR
jgi:hypothetical protein